MITARLRPGGLVVLAGRAGRVLFSSAGVVQIIGVWTRENPGQGADPTGAN